MKVKSVVKVMNFHALVRVDKARRNAEKYFQMEEKLRGMIDSITTNMNLVLDKYVLVVNKDMPVLNIYVGSDMGFCGGYNFTVNEVAIKDKTSSKVIIGKKIWDTFDNVVFRSTKADYMENHSELDNFLMEAVLKGSFSEINILYNEYENTSSIKWVSKRVFPFDFDTKTKSNSNEDFICETDINDMLRRMVSTYVGFEVMLTVINSFASENVMRENSTSESLKKIDEIEESEYLKERKEINTKQFQQVIDKYSRFKFAGNKK